MFNCIAINKVIVTFIGKIFQNLWQKFILNYFSINRGYKYKNWNLILIYSICFSGYVFSLK